MRLKKSLKPSIGDERTVTKFAWLPILINGYYVWLEKYYIHQKFSECKTLGFYYKPGWHWIKILKYSIMAKKRTSTRKETYKRGAILDTNLGDIKQLFNLKNKEYELRTQEWFSDGSMEFTITIRMAPEEVKREVE